MFRYEESSHTRRKDLVDSETTVIVRLPRVYYVNDSNYMGTTPNKDKVRVSNTEAPIG